MSTRPRKPPVRQRTHTAESASASAIKQPTIHDVARAAKVSIATVSNVMNNRSSAAGEKTRKLVRHHIAQLGYRTHAAGRGLRTSRRNFVAMVMIDESANYLSDPFVANLVAGFTDAVNSRGYATVVHGCRRGDLEDTVVIKTLGVDGYCLSLSGDAAARVDLATRLRELNQPLVLAQETVIKPDKDLCIVRQDDFGGGVQLADHLLARRVKRLMVVLSKLEWPSFNARLEGLRAGIQRTGQSTKIEVIRARSEAFVDCVAAVSEYLAAGNRPDAIVGGNDQIGLSAMYAVQAAGLSVPKDVLVTGFNALDFWQYSTPRLTTVRSRPREIGVAAGSALIDRLETGVFRDNEIILPVALIPAASTEQ